MPRWPATQTRLPVRSNSGVAGSLADVIGRRTVAIVQSWRFLRSISRRTSTRSRRPSPAPVRRNVVLCCQPSFASRLGRIAEQQVDLGRPEIARIDLDQRPCRSASSIPFSSTPAAAASRCVGRPGRRRARRTRAPSASRRSRARSRRARPAAAISHMPSTIVAGVAPVALGIEIAEIEPVLQPELDRRDRAGDLAGDEGLAADRALVVEQDAVGGVHAVGLAVVHRDPVGVELGRGVGRARIERRGLALRHLLHLAVQLRGRGLIEAHASRPCRGCGSPRAAAACRARRHWRCIPASRS